METDAPFWQWSPWFLLLYFAPVAIGAVRRFRSRSASWPAWALFLVVLLTGWTVIGWLFALRMAFRDKALPGMGARPASAPAAETANSWGTVYYDQYEFEDGWVDYITRIGTLPVASERSSDGTHFITRIGDMPVETSMSLGNPS